MIINGLLLPELLQNLIREGRWNKPKNMHALKQIIGSERADDFAFLDINNIRQETTAMRRVNDDNLGHIYGTASSLQSGKNIDEETILDVDKAVLIAINFDEESICLDYRVSDKNPRVMVSVWGNDDNLRWKMVSPDFKSFVEHLDL